MKILVIQPWLSYRGAETVSVSLVRELERQGHSVKLVAVYVDRERPPVGCDSVSVICAPALLSIVCQAHPILFLLFGPVTLLALAWKNSRGVDILNPHNPPALLVAAIIGRARRIPVVWSCHSLPFSSHWKKKVSLLDFLAWRLAKSRPERWALGDASLIISNSQPIAKQLMGAYGLPSHVIYPPLSGSPWRSPRSMHEERKVGRILVVGRLDRRKNQAAAIRAFSMLAPIAPSATMLIAGEGSYKPRLLQLARALGVEHRVRFLGYVASDRLKELYATSDLALVPALDEPWGLTPFEAISAGCLPVVSSQAGSAEVVEAEGIGIVTEPDHISIYRGLRMCFHEGFDRVAMVLRGKRFLDENLWEDQYALDCLELFEAAIMNGSEGIFHRRGLSREEALLEDEHVEALTGWG